VWSEAGITKAVTGPRLVVIGGGHLVDDPGRSPTRFPPEAESRVAAALAEVLRRWEVGPGCVVLSQGARGADILIAEAARQLGAQVQLYLALPPREFERRSVDLPRSQWVDRFRALVDGCPTQVQVERLGAPDDEDVFVRNNRWVLDEASALATRTGAELRGLVLWDGGLGDSGSITSDFVGMLGEGCAEVEIVHPATAWRTPNTPYWERQGSPGAKRLLALDGGGMRGIVALEVLARMEDVLSGGDPTFALGDWFDYVAGTSTGAIIAASLSLGMRVAAIRDLYQDLGRSIFRKRFFPARFRSIYKDTGLTTELGRCLGSDRQFGSDDLRCLLLVVTHRVDTDSTWPLSNNTWAVYNDPSRPDCNLRFNLSKIVRGSAAAPVYFTPEEIALERSTALFEDGGITPFNNPALLLFEMATSQRYRLGWPATAEQLLLVSVGTGTAAAAHPTLTLRRITLLFQGKNMLRVMMNGSATENDRLCRVLGECRHGAPIDGEFDDPAVAKAPVSKLFTYVRYNADLSPDGLQRAGLGHINSRRVARLDGVGAIDDLVAVGQKAADQVTLEHFAGFHS
jgi:hypothetical protein